MPRKSYHEACSPIIITVIADAVAKRPYTAQEFSSNLRSQRDIDEVEQARLKMTEAEIDEFVRVCDERCCHAYLLKSDWFMKCLRANGNRGRDQLYVWLTHWLVSYLLGSRERFIGEVRNSKEYSQIKEILRVPFYECGCCGAYHPAYWDGDCRDDDYRFAIDEIDARFGSEGWVEVDQPDGSMSIAANFRGGVKTGYAPKNLMRGKLK